MDYLVLKLTASPPKGQATDWTPVLIARGVEDKGEEAEKAAIAEAYTGEGTYKAVVWDEDTEARVGPPAPPEVAIVSKRALEEAAEAEAVER